jgi:transcription-repair coupling factor (superfamily II helicase)
MALRSLLQLWKRSEGYREMLGRLASGDRQVDLGGLAGSAVSFLAAGLQQHTSRPLLLVCVDDPAAETHAEEIQAFIQGKEGAAGEVAFFPGAAEGDAETKRARLSVLQRLVSDGSIAVVVAGLKSSLEALPRPAAWQARSFCISVGQALVVEDLCQRLVGIGYERDSLTDRPGIFSLRGGIVDIFPPAADLPYRLELWDETVESIRLFDPAGQLSRRRVERADISPAGEASPESEGGATLVDHLPEQTLLLLEEPGKLQAQYDRISRHHPELLHLDEARRLWEKRQVLTTCLLGAAMAGGLNFEARFQDSFGGRLPEAVAAVRRWRKEECAVVMVSDQASRLRELLSAHELVVGDRPERFLQQPIAVRDNIDRGFRIPEIGLAVLTDQEIFGWRKNRVRRGAFAFSETERLSLLEARPGDYVIHVQHGLGRYLGLVRLETDGVAREYLHIQYAGNDKLYVPSDQIDRLQKHISGSEEELRLHSLGGGEWKRTTSRVRKATRDMARELLSLYARREGAPGFAFSADTPWQTEMENAFAYPETPDQMRAIQETKQDMESPLPMDRLICGDVGYGKTEVAIRAAFKAVQDGRQVGLLAPTTVLALQHFNTFRQRLGAYPVNMEMLSRFRARRDQQEILRRLETGELDIVIGTHRLIQKDVRFNNLGLLIIDEEQRFGVADKERLKQMRLSVDILTMTATPIPRTLHMSLSGLRRISVIDTAPEGRMPVRTVLCRYDEETVRQAVEGELDRGGQVYFVTNRIEGIENHAATLQKHFPYARIAVAHGRMPEARLEKTMVGFYEKDYDILVCTAIIENGVDVPSVNTIIINDADRMGLAQLYQLRGRVGRGYHQAYALLLYRDETLLSDVAVRRLASIREFSELGSGMKIAMRDLQIRGAGNILGAQQHGFVQAVGLELYSSMLAESVAELKGELPQQKPQPAIDLPFDAFIPAAYIDDDRLRLEFYRRLATVEDQQALDRVAAEMADRFGRCPREVNNLIFVVRLKLLAAARQLRFIQTEGRRLVIGGNLPSRSRLRQSGGLVGRYRKHVLLLADRLMIDTAGLTVREWTSLLEATLDLLDDRENCA